MSSDNARRPRRRFWAEALLAAIFVVTAVMTASDSEWIEAVFGIHPDAGSGALEWALVAVTGLGAIVAAQLARREWRRRPQAGRHPGPPLRLSRSDG